MAEICRVRGKRVKRAKINAFQTKRDKKKEMRVFDYIEMYGGRPLQVKAFVPRPSFLVGILGCCLVSSASFSG